jgi:hypothetical protein
MKCETNILTLLKEKMMAKGYSFKTEQFYLHTIKEYISFHGKRDPRYMGMEEIDLFMRHLFSKQGYQVRMKQKVFQALMFFYTQVLHIALQKEYINASRAENHLHNVRQLQHKPVQRVMVF